MKNQMNSSDSTLDIREYWYISDVKQQIHRWFSLLWHFSLYLSCLFKQSELGSSTDINGDYNGEYSESDITISITKHIFSILFGHNLYY